MNHWDEIKRAGERWEASRANLDRARALVAECEAEERSAFDALQQAVKAATGTRMVPAHTIDARRWTCPECHKEMRQTSRQKHLHDRHPDVPSAGLPGRRKKNETPMSTNGRTPEPKEEPSNPFH